MNKNKKIIIAVVISFIIIIGLILLLNIFNKSSSNQKKASDNSISETVKSDTSIDQDIDFSTYKTYEVVLEDSYNITEAGVYHITGTLKNGSITVNTDDNVKIILDNVSITNTNGPAVNVESANNVYIELVGENNLSSTTTEELDGCIYSSDDLLIYGDGSITIKSNYDGIVSKDDLVIKSGTYIINTDDDGIRGKDSVVIYDGNFTINSKGDAIKTTNEEEKGSLAIYSGTFKIKTTGEGAKGIKAENNIYIENGIFDIDSSDDAIHSNTNITINNGEFKINSSDDAIHADGLIEISDGKFNITAHEGIEATYVKINDGTINISASDDGINATNKSTDYSATIEINGGYITVDMGQGDTDAIDSNGNIYVNGGTLDITAQSAFDYDGEAKYTGGTIIVNGTTTNQITNQMMGGAMNQGMMPNGGDQFNQGQRGGMVRR